MKDHIKLLFAFEMSYVNTNHDDFIGFTRAQANTANEVKRNNIEPENKVIRSGWLSIANTGMMRGKLIHFSKPFLISTCVRILTNLVLTVHHTVTVQDLFTPSHCHTNLISE